MPDFNVFSLLEIPKRKHRSHGSGNNGNIKRKNTALKKSTTSLKVLSDISKNHSRHSMLSFLSSLPIRFLSSAF